MAQPNLLYITPTVPSPTGNGLSMRAYHMAESLASRYRLYLLIVSIRSGRQPKDLPAFPFCQEVVFLPVERFKDIHLFLTHQIYKRLPEFYYWCFSKPSEWVFITNQRIRTAARLFPQIRFDVIHLFRLYMSPFMKAFSSRLLSGTTQLDLDDLESFTRYRMSQLYRLNGFSKMAKMCERESSLYASIERRTLPVFDRIFVCSEMDRKKLEDDYHCKKAEVVPNVVKIPPEVPRAPKCETFSYLFVGTFSYYPNVDAILFFLRKDCTVYPSVCSSEI